MTPKENLTSLIYVCPQPLMRVQNNQGLQGVIKKVKWCYPFPGECLITIRWDNGEVVELYHFETSNNHPVFLAPRKD